MAYYPPRDDGDITPRRRARLRETGVEDAPSPAPATAAGGGGGGNGFAGGWQSPSGYDYTGWGNTHASGSRPPTKVDWDAMSQEQRNAIGLGTWDQYKSAAKAWRSRFAPGGDINAEQQRQEAVIASMNPGSEEELMAAMRAAGLSPEKEAGQARWKQLLGRWRGDIDPSGRYHWNGSAWVDVATSDLAKRGVAGAADYTGPRVTGLAAVAPEAARHAEMAGTAMEKWAAAGSIQKVGGNYYDPDSNQYFNAQGYGIDPQTGQLTGTAFHSSNISFNPAGGRAGSGSSLVSLPGGGGGGSSQTDAYSGPGNGGAIGQQLQDALSKILAGEDLPWNADQIGRTKQELFETVQGRKKAALGNIDRDAVRRGIYRSGIAAEQAGETERQASSTYAQGSRAVDSQAVTENYQARMAGMDRAQKYLDSLREYWLKRDANDIARQSALAQIQLGYARIDSDRWQLQQQLAQNQSQFDESLWWTQIMNRLFPNEYGTAATGNV